MWWCIKQLKLLRRVWRWDGDERAWALGLAVGVFVGLIPKGNLTAVLAMAALLSLRANLAVGLVAATLTSWLAPLLDPITHPIGQLALGAAWLEPFWVRLHRLPLVPWLRWNNTVVMGTLIVGLALMGPLYAGALAALGASQRRRRKPVALLPAPAALTKSLGADTVLVVPSIKSPPDGHASRSPWRGKAAA